MPTTTSETRPAPWRRGNRVAVAAAAVLGAAAGAVALATGRPGTAVGFVLVTWGFAAFLLVGARRSDLVALLADDRHEERHVQLHQRAALYTVNLVAAVLVGGFLVDLARGGTGWPWTLVLAVLGVSYLGCLVGLSRRN